VCGADDIGGDVLLGVMFFARFDKRLRAIFLIQYSRSFFVPDKLVLDPRSFAHEIKGARHE
jgi:hypothetical protein